MRKSKAQILDEKKEEIVRSLEDKPQFFEVPYKKTVWGYVTIEAKTVTDAKDKFVNGEWDDEFDNDSEYEWDDMIEQETGKVV